MATFPSHSVNPKDKLSGKDWIFQMVEAIWTEFNGQSIKSFHKGVSRYALNTLYGLGKPPLDIYKPMFEVAEDDNASFMNLDYSPPPIIPKFKRITLGRFSKMDFTVSASAIDPYSLEEDTHYEAEQRAKIKVREMLSELGVESQVVSPEDGDPQDEQELSIQMEYGYKNNNAIVIEKDIDSVFSFGRLKDKLARVRSIGFDTGLFGFKAYTDEDTGHVGFRPVETAGLVVSPTKDPKFEDIWYCGEVVMMSIDEIRRENAATNGGLTEQDLEDIARKNSAINGNPQSYGLSSVGSYLYDNHKAPVLDIEFLSQNDQTFEETKDKYGNPVSGRVAKKENKKGSKYTDESKIVVYRAKWPVDTRHIFNYGLKSDIYQKPSSEWDTRLSYILCAPELNLMETSPVIENLIPIADQITIAWYKLQNVIARARPKGIMIEIGALEEISLGDGNLANMKPIRLLDMFNQTGTLVYRRINMDGTPLGYKPIEELTNGLGSEAQEYFAVIKEYMGLLSQIIGFNELSDGSTPDPKTLNGVAGLAVENTNNALQHLLDAERYVVERLADEVAVRVFNSKTYKKNSPYRVKKPGNGMRAINSGQDGSIEREFNIVLAYASDKVDKLKLEGRINQSMANKEITLADALAIEHVRNLKQAELLLAYRIKKNQDLAAKYKQQEQMNNANASAIAAQAAEKEKRITAQEDWNREEQAKNLEAERKAALITLEYNLKLMLEMPKLENKEEIERISGEFNERISKIKAGAQIATAKEKPKKAA